MTEARAWWVVDSGHGWLAVPLVSCEGLTFSEYSYVDRVAGEAYLEEDCDAGVWIRAHGLGRDDVRAFPVDHVAGDAWVRDLPRLVSPRSVV